MSTAHVPVIYYHNDATKQLTIKCQWPAASSIYCSHVWVVSLLALLILAGLAHMLRGGLAVG